MPPGRTANDGTPQVGVRFSQANKLCFRATAAQSVWVAGHLAATERSITRVLRDALDLYIRSHRPRCFAPPATPSSPTSPSKPTGTPPTMTTGPSAENRPANVYSYLDLSTGHLPQQVFAQLRDIPGVIADDYPYGIWLYVPQDIDEWLGYPADTAQTSAHSAGLPRVRATGHPAGWPAELQAVLRRARQLGCGFVRLDQDGAIDETLPVWEW